MSSGSRLVYQGVFLASSQCLRKRGYSDDRQARDVRVQPSRPRWLSMPPAAFSKIYLTRIVYVLVGRGWQFLRGWCVPPWRVSSTIHWTIESCANISPLHQGQKCNSQPHLITVCRPKWRINLRLTLRFIFLIFRRQLPRPDFVVASPVRSNLAASYRTVLIRPSSL